MARYSNATYGIDLYGPDAFNATDFVTVLTALSGAFVSVLPSPHRVITLLWTKPTGTWDRLRLVRSRVGTPVDEQDGEVLVDIDSASLLSRFQDEGLLDSTYYYYSIFVRTTHSDGTFRWVSAGTDRGLSVGDRGYADLLLERLPRVFTTPNSATVEPESDSTLAKFLSLFGFHFDSYRDRLEALFSVNDADRVPGDLLPNLLDELGFSYEAEIGMRQNRVLARNAVVLAQNKGTAIGLAGLVSSVTGWGTTARGLANLILTEDDASATSSVGNWTCTGAITQVTAVSLDGSAFKIKSVGSTSNVTARLGNTLPLTQGIPIVGGKVYNYSVALKNGDPYAPVLGGSFFGDGATGTVSATSSAPDSQDGSFTRYTVTVTPFGTTGMLFVPSVFLSALPTSVDVFMDHVVIAEHTEYRGYSAPRVILLECAADRINEFVNGGFDANTNTWSATGASLAWSGSDVYDTGAGSGILTASASTWVLSTTVGLTPSRAYVGSLRLRASVGSPNLTGALVTFFDTTGIQVQQTPISLTGPALTTVWDRRSISFDVPAAAASATVAFTFTGASGNKVTVDDGLLEIGFKIQDYFDRQQQRDNVLYEGPVSASRLHFYRNRLPRTYRAEGLLTSSLPLDSAYELLFAQGRPQNFTGGFTGGYTNGYSNSYSNGSGNAYTTSYGVVYP